MPAKRARSSDAPAAAPVALADTDRDQAAFREQLAAHWRAGTLCDVSIAVGEGAERQTFAAHRLVLSAGSGYFSGLFRAATSDGAAPTVELPEMAAPAFAAVLEYIYTGGCNPGEDVLGALLAAAARLQVPSLQRAAAEAVKARLAPENCLAWWDAAEGLGLPALAEAAKEAALRGFEAAVGADDALAGTTQPRLLELISDKRLTARGEEAVHTAVVRWARLHPEAAEEAVLQLFGGVRFTLLGKDFVRGTVNKEPLLLTVAGQRLVADAFQQLAFGEVMPRRLGFGPRAMYALGLGDDKKGVQIFEAESQTWRGGPPLDVVREYGCAAVLDGTIYAIGGVASGGYTTSVSILAPEAAAWQAGPVLATARGYPAAVVLDGKIYAIGGYSGALGHLSSVEVYDPQVGTWQAGPPLGTARFRLAVAVLGGKIYAVGGSSSFFTAVANELSSVEVYDPQVGAWQAGPPLATARIMAGLAVLDGKLYAVGGTGGGGSTSSVEVLDPQVGSWQAGPPLPTPTTLLGGGLQVLEGKLHAIDRQGGAMHVLDTQASSWQPGGPKLPGTGISFMSCTC